MPKIKITEKNETTSGVILDNTDIVFVPGFVLAELSNFGVANDTELKEIAIPAGEPTLFTSTDDFVRACGKAPAVLETDTKGNPTAYDTGYLYAKELLASGLSVMYYRVNEDGDTYTKVTQQPVEWAERYGDYYELVDGEYKHIEGETVYNMIPIMQEPEDWGVDVESYFVKSEGDYIPVTTETPFVPGEIYKEDKSNDKVVPLFDADNTYKGGQEISVDAMNSALERLFSVEDAYGIVDKGNYSIKYLTSGGYPSYNNETHESTIAFKMMGLAADRGDCVALIDYAESKDNISVISTDVKKDFAGAEGEYGAMFAPWADYNRLTTGGPDVIRMPASFAYLKALANAIKIYPNWLAISGATRGKVPALARIADADRIPNKIADDIQNREDRTGLIAINSITKIKPYGDVIWGNRTMEPISEDLTALHFLNLRNMISDIKKVVYSTARALTFEQDSDVLWLNFKSKITPLLDRMVSGNGLVGYKIVKDTEHPNAKKKGVLCAKIILYPAYAVEDFYITVIMRDADDVTVE